MTELVDTKRRIRLTEPYAFYDDRATHMWRSWPAGAVIEDPREIELLTARGAQFEIEQSESEIKK
jgi:hypothetical protein